MPSGKRACCSAARKIAPSSSSRSVVTHTRTYKLLDRAESHIWISDQLLHRAFTRFATTFGPRQHQKRKSSHVPGPLEARRRLDKRRFAMAVPPSRTTRGIWNDLRLVWSWLTGHLSSGVFQHYRPQLHWEPPNILVRSSSQGQIKPLQPDRAWILASPSVQSPDLDGQVVAQNKSQFLLQGSRSWSAQLAQVRQSDPGVNLNSAQDIARPQNTLTYSQTSYLVPQSAVGRTINNTSLRSLFDFVAKENLSVKDYSERRLIHKSILSIVEAQGATDREIHALFELEKLLFSDSRASVMPTTGEEINYLASIGHALLSHQRGVGLSLPPLAAIIGEIQHVVRTRRDVPQQLVALLSSILRFVCPRLEKMQHSVNSYVTKWFEFLKLHAEQSSGLDTMVANPTNFLGSLTHLIQEPPLGGNTDSNKSLQTVVELTRTLCHARDAKRWLTTWMEFLRDAEVLRQPISKTSGSNQSINSPTRLFENAAWDAVIKSYTNEGDLVPILRSCSLGSLARFLLYRAMIASNQLDRKAGQNVTNDESYKTFSLALRAQSLWLFDLIPRPSFLSVCRTMLLRGPKEPDIYEATQNAILTTVFERCGADDFHLLLRGLSRKGVVLAPEPLAQIVPRIARSSPGLAMKICRLKPTALYRRQKSFMFAVSRQCSTSDMFQLLHRSQPAWQLYDEVFNGRQTLKKLKPEWVKFIHDLALRFAAMQGCSTRVAFRNVYACYRYLKSHDAPIRKDLARAFVHSYIIKGLEQREWIKPERVKWILRFVRDLEGEDAAREVDALAFNWRERVGRFHKTVSTQKCAHQNIS